MKRISFGLAITMLLGACGSPSGGEAPRTQAPPTIESTTVTEPVTTVSSDTTLPPDTTTTTATVSGGSTTLPGEPSEIGPAAGEELAVMGVRHDDVLNVRAAPGTDHSVLTTLEPTAEDAVATGRARRLSQSFWWEVRANGVTGWASAAFLTRLGSTDDVTAAVIDQMGGRPEHETMEGLGRMVAEALASHEEPVSRISQTTPAVVGDLGEVTFDLVGFPDDSVFGLRLHVFGEPLEGGFALRTVEQTLFCGRGVDPEGRCV